MRPEKIYSVLDRKLREFGPLLLERNEASVCRAIRAGIPGSGSMMEKYPEDYDLYEIGVFDKETGVIVQEVPHLVDTLTAILGADVSGALPLKAAKEA